MAAADSAASAAPTNRRTRRRRLRRPRDSQRRLGIRQQPDRDRGRDPPHHPDGDRSRQGQRHRQEARRRLAPVRALYRYWARRCSRIRARCRRTTSRRWCRRSSTSAIKNKDVVTVTASVGFEHEWKYFAAREGSYIEQEVWSIDALLHRHGAEGRPDAVAHLHRRDDDRRLGDRRARADARERRADRRRSGRVLHRQAGRDGPPGSRS